MSEKKKKDTATQEAEAAVAVNAYDEAENATVAKVASDDGFSMYLGPTIARVIRHGSMYRGTREAVLNSLSDKIEKYPLIATMVISDKTLATDRIKIKTPGNVLYVNYHKLAKTLG